MKVFKSKSIKIGKEAYRYLNSIQREQRGCKALSDEQFDNLWHRATKFGEQDFYIATNDSFGGGDGTYNGKWTDWDVDKLKEMLDAQGLPYEDGEDVERVCL